MAQGTLYVVATPIGNLEDITLRALRVLREVDLVACEDTRHTRKLLERYSIDKPLLSYHEHNERERTEQLLERLAGGAHVALVSDAGTPLISDPGYRLVEAARSAGIAVIPVPGPSAVVAALSASGLPTDAFLFVGFLPSKPGPRKALLEQFRDLPATLVCYEAPHRIRETLGDAAEILGSGRSAVLAREVSKVHEEFLRGSLQELREELARRGTMKGELVLMIARAQQEEGSPAEAAGEVSRLMEQGWSRMEAIKEVARRRGLGKRQLYAQLEASKHSH